MAAAKETQQRIADAVGLSVPTLTKYYFRELEQGAAIIRGEALGLAWKAAKAGNATALNAVFRQLDKAEALPTPRRARTKVEETLGKKAQANEDALVAHEGTGWDDLLTRPH